MVGVALDWLFDVVCERAVLTLGARVLWALRRGRRPFSEQMERSVPNLLAGLLAWAALVAAVVALLGGGSSAGRLP